MFFQSKDRKKSFWSVIDEFDKIGKFFSMFWATFAKKKDEVPVQKKKLKIKF